MNEDLHRQWEEKEQFPPYEFSLEMGKEMFSKPFKNGKTYADCFPNGGIGIRQNYPYFDDKQRKVITLELALNRCREANGEQPYSYVRDEMAALTALSDRPSGTLRITCTDHMIVSIFRPKLAAFLRAHPEVRVELDMNYALVDVVAERFDAGVRIGEALAKDMVATRIGPDWRFSVVATPEYFKGVPPPVTPTDLSRHNCISLRMATAGGFLPWEFRAPNGRDLRVKVQGQAAFNTITHVLEAALDGIGLAFVPQDMAAPHLASGQLVEVLTDWCPLYDGFHLYYPSRKQHAPAFAAFIEAMRYRG